MRFSEHLIDTLSNIRKTYPLLRLFDRSTYLRNLIVVFHVITASENLLRVAADRSEPASALHDYFLAHLAEEREHEAWLTADLAIAGVDVRKTTIPRAVVEMVGSQYYLLFHVDPAALLGYMAVLECFPTPMRDIEALESAHGPQLVRTSRYHAEHDVDHGCDLLDVIDALPEERRQIVFESAVQAAHYLRAALVEIE